MANATDLFVGVWRLVWSIEITPEGKREYPFGQDAIGYICYSQAGIMAVQISRKSRQPEADPSNLPREYVAYFGRYEVDSGRQVVRHLVEGALFPAVHLKTLERRYTFEGDLLSLKPLDGTNREILWQRVPKSHFSEGPPDR